MLETTPMKFDLTYHQAFMHEMTCTYNDKYDWRVPTIDENWELGIGWAWCKEAAYQDPDIDLMHLILVRDPDD